MEFLLPHLEPIIKVLISVLVSIFIAAMLELRKRVLKWIESRTTNEQRENIYKWADEAFSFAETVFKDSGGSQKMDAAYKYLSNRLNEKGIKLSPQEIKGTIEKSVLQYNSRMKPNG